MHSESKVPPSSEVSLKYMAWDMKNLVKELNRLNEILEKIIQNKDAAQF